MQGVVVPSSTAQQCGTQLAPQCRERRPPCWGRWECPEWKLEADGRPHSYPSRKQTCSCRASCTRWRPKFSGCNGGQTSAPPASRHDTYLHGFVLRSTAESPVFVVIGSDLNATPLNYSVLLRNNHARGCNGCLVWAGVSHACHGGHFLRTVSTRHFLFLCARKVESVRVAAMM